jgi:hypothetical protein
LVEGDDPLERVDRALGRQQDAGVAVEDHVPAPLAHPHEAAHLGRDRRGGGKECQRLVDGVLGPSPAISGRSARSARSAIMPVIAPSASMSRSPSA